MSRARTCRLCVLLASLTLEAAGGKSLHRPLYSHACPQRNPSRPPGPQKTAFTPPTVVESFVTDCSQFGKGVGRTAEFWSRALHIYGSYKSFQLRCALTLPLIRDKQRREAVRLERWGAQHEKNSDRMLEMCLALKGFHLKAGQFLATRPDFMPTAFLYKLSALHDRVPAMPGSKVKVLVEAALGRPLEEVFESIELGTPLGAASISQVHAAVMKGSGESAVVKVQYPGAQKLMMADLRDLRLLGRWLQRFDLKFDLISAVDELKTQIAQEFDFEREAQNMKRAAASLAEFRDVHIASPIIATPTVLVMTRLHGASLSGGSWLAKQSVISTTICTRLLTTLAHVWGKTILTDGFFNADPHPGNLLIMKGLHLGLLDWGQTKALTLPQRRRLAHMFVALSSTNETAVVEAFHGLGIKLVGGGAPAATVYRMAYSMFDTRHMPGMELNPFSKEGAADDVAVQSFPSELFFVLRSCQLLRGMATGMEVDISTADVFAGYARKFLLEADSLEELSAQP